MRNSFFFLMMVILLAGCKSATELLREGRYEKAAYSSAAKLMKEPGNTEMQKTLVQSYQQTLHWYDSLIDLSERTASRDRFEKQFEYYTALQQLTATLKKLPETAKTNLQFHDYSQPLADVATRAAAERYDLGMMLLNQNNKSDALEAWKNFKKAEEYDPSYKDVGLKAETAYQAAITLVEVDLLQERLPLFNVQASWLQQSILWNLETIRPEHTLLKFTSTQTGTTMPGIPDQKLLLDFTDLRFDPPFTDTYSYERTREVTVTDAQGNQHVVMVQATIFVTRKAARARTVLRADLRSMTDSRTLLYEMFPAEYNWRSLTGRFTGDARALTADDLSIINNIETPPPSADELFRMLTEKCTNDLVFRLRTIYK